MSAQQKPFGQTIEQPEPAAIHQRFSWAHGKAKHTPEATQAERTKNIAQGISTCIGMIHSSELDRENGDAPLLRSFDVDVLFRFVMASADLLAERADMSIWDMNESHRDSLQ